MVVSPRFERTRKAPISVGAALVSAWLLTTLNVAVFLALSRRTLFVNLPAEEQQHILSVRPPVTDIVVAFCKHPIDWLNHFTCDDRLRTIHIYSKCGSSVPDVLPQCSQVHVIGNRGREAEAYLTHIVNHYNESEQADTTVFLQDDQDELYVPIPLVVEYASRHEFAALSGVVREAWRFESLHNINGSVTDAWIQKYLPEWNERLQRNEIWLTAWRGEFSVSKRRILANPLSMYQEALALHQGPRIGVDAFHGFETSWNIMFNCTESQFLILARTTHYAFGRKIKKKGNGHLIC